MYTALQQLDAPAFWRTIVIFAVLATINVLLILVNFYIAQRQIINWRLWLNEPDAGRLAGRGRLPPQPLRRPSRSTTPTSASRRTSPPTPASPRRLALGAVSSMVSLVSFTIILWGLSGPLSLFGVTIPRGMVFVAYVYVIIATLIAFRIGRPLIRLNFLNELLTASYRYALVRVRENSENIAFYRGEPVENAGLLGRFAGGHRQHLGDRVPEPEVPGLQPGGQPDRRGVPDHHPGAPLLQRSDHPGRRHPDRDGLRSGASTRCRSSDWRTTTSPATAPCWTGSPGCSTSTTRPARCPRRPPRSGRAGWPSAISQVAAARRSAAAQRPGAPRSTKAAPC